VIRFTGNSGGDKVDVLLENKGGRFLAHWPKAQTRTSGLLWSNVVIGEQPAAADAKDPLGASSWINQLRTSAASALLRDGKGEPFLLYDAEPNYKLPLKVTAGEGELSYRLTNSGTVGVKDLAFYKKQADGWHTALIADLPPTNPGKPATKPTTGAASKPTTVASTMPATAPTTAPIAATVPTTTPATPTAQPVATVATSQPIGSTTTRAVATTQAASQPASKPAIGFPVVLASTKIDDARLVLAPWRQKLVAAGLPPTDQDLIIGILEKHALESTRLTAIYRLEADQLDQLMNLDIVPSPRKTIRVGLVIVKNIDPAIVSEIEALAAQLGDPKWDKREAAHKRLAELGLAARPKLQTILKSSKDPEIVYRIERLLEASATQAPGQPDNGNQQIDR
jgi:hypothetical protein